MFTAGGGHLFLGWRIGRAGVLAVVGALAGLTATWGSRLHSG
ncbi:hypothetical protein [Streptomyces mutabilis]|nr:hypothetical protein [Streptomyces mutabilis]